MERSRSFQTSTTSSGSNAGNSYGITSGSNGTLAFTAVIPAAIGTITTGGQVSSIPVPASPLDIEPSPMPGDLSTGPDGSLWWIDDSNNTIGELSASGVFHTYLIPTLNAMYHNGGWACESNHCGT